LVLLAAGQLSAQVTPTPPFTGPYTESFETQTSPPFIQCIAGRVFDGRADLCTEPGAGTLITSGWGFNCSIGPHSGGHFYGSANGATRVTFDNAVAKFGGYFGSNGDANVSGGAAVTFFDAANNPIGNDTITFTGCGQWQWAGWQSTTPIKSVLISGNGYGGPFVDMDDLEFDAGGSVPGCYANCDGSTTIPFLNVNDFVCFQTAFAAGASYANCDNSTSPPVLNIGDFVCFQSAFAAGCSAP
jgi:hypothetical protein